ncbi:MAG: DedA family protein [Balneolaceae bacterium]
MEFYTQQLIEWIQALSPLSIYFMFGIIAYAENIIPPIPGDILIVFGGYLAAEQIVGFSIVLGITTFASVIGFMSMYAIGKYFGDRIDERRKKFWLMRFLDVKYFDKANRWMDRWGQWVIVANRFLVGTRSIISLTAGLTRTKIYQTIINSSVSSLVWNFVLLGLGWLVNENWQIIGHYLNIYGTVILSIVVLLVGAKLIYNRFKKDDVLQ